jgi:hypothetical protein
MWWKNRVAVLTLEIEVVVGIKMAYLVSLSTITKILSNPSDSGNSGMKSMETTLKGKVGIGMGCNSPAGAWCLGLDFWQISQVETYHLISRDILGQ